MNGKVTIAAYKQMHSIHFCSNLINTHKFYSKKFLFLLYVGKIVNDKVIEVYESLQPLSKDKNEITNETIITEDTNKNSPIQDEQLTSIENSSAELFYDFQAENFHAEQVYYCSFI
jgi:hypothetical protein